MPAMVVAAVLAMLPFAHAEEFDFDMLSDSDIKMGVGKLSDGSAVALSNDNPKTGKQCLKLVYNIEPGNGYAEFIFNQRGLTPKFTLAGIWKVSFWVRGDTAVKAGPVGIRLLDARGEVFQFMLPRIDSALRKPEWNLYETELNLDASQGHWGNNSDGVADAPLRLFSLAINGGSAGDSGSIYIDDLKIEPVEKK
ncbi:MAG: hypothetical protein ACAI35_19280 [Candidatus Methylacidiphilales bacterium]|nr:hypothetical protein [Candidatus Methylacidiphilales bacterium]